MSEQHSPAKRTTRETGDAVNHVLITAHKGADIYDSCRLCGADVYRKRNQVALYLARDDGLASVCWECARCQDPATADLLGEDRELVRTP